MRSHRCTQILEPAVGETVQVCGWVNSRRDHGGIIFIDLRDSSGIVQIVADPGVLADFSLAESIRSEYVLSIRGLVRIRPEGTENPLLPTGAVEIVAESIDLLNEAASLPFQLDDEDVNEALRLKYRYVDLRRGRMQRNIRLRHQLVKEIRSFLDENEFIDIETPMLTRSTPEGARDYVVPSRVHAGMFYALPQSPQLFKQMLVISGFERYYQIVRCFRDEDLRADRQPEFTQLDLEMAFVDESDVIKLMENLFQKIFMQLMNVSVGPKFPKLRYEEAMRRFGTDRPDLRNPLELTELTEAMREVEFQVFNRAANLPDGRVAALNIPQGASLTRLQIDQYTDFVSDYGAKGLAYIKVNDRSKGIDGLQSPILKFLSEPAVETIVEHANSQSGDLIFFGADACSIVNASLGALRDKVGEDLGLLEEGWKLAWIVDFPLLEYDDAEKRWHATHHPFTSPNLEHADKLASDPSSVNSRAYDLVLNGVEIGGGSIRNHRADIQKKVFDALNLGDDEIQAKFGFLLEALQTGAPPHGGIAFGIDRIAALLAGEESIRDVIAFPKTQRAYCALTQAPNEISPSQLNELALRLKPSAKSI